MVSIKTFKELALSFPGVEEQPHFERVAFRSKKGIFTTLHEESYTANVRLTAIDQSVFCAFDKTVIYPVDNKWGLKGWTTVNLKKVRKDMLKDILNTAYNTLNAKR